MSHVAEIEVEIKDIAALKAACDRLGTVEFMEGQKTYKWYGKHVGDYPVPAGFNVADLGKCDHAIRVKGNSGAYEIGVVKRRDGRPGYTLHWDFWGRGKGLQNVVGDNCRNVRQSYAVEVAKRAAIRKGLRVREQKQQDGSVRLVCARR